MSLNLRFTAIVVGVLAAVMAAIIFPTVRQSGKPVEAPVVGITSYCLPDGSGMRVFERPFPSGGTQPLFSVIFAGELSKDNPMYCELS